MKSIFLVYTTLFFNLALNANTLCLSTFNMSSSPEGSDPTSIFLNYLGNIFDSNAVNVDDLKRLQMNLKNNTLENPIEYSAAATNSILQISWEYFEDLIHGQILNQNRILNWVSKTLDSIESSTNHKDQQIRLTEDRQFVPMTFHPIKIDEFKYIEVMSTLLTQYHWFKVMGKNPSYFSSGFNSIILKRNNLKISLRPNHPVENITLFSALEFSNELSRQMGLNPYYDFSNTTWEENTSASEGTLELKKIVGKFYYGGNGFRLPKDQENVFYTSRNDNYLSFINLDLMSIGWFLENSEGETQEVQTLQPIYFQDRPFYDLFGNVEEWHTNSQNHSGNSSGFNFLGGSYHRSIADLKDVEYCNANTRSSRIGLRLVRSITKDEYMEKLK